MPGRHFEAGTVVESERLGQPFVVENRPGSGGDVGFTVIAKAPADGYTIGMATVSTLATNPATNPRTPYDPINDFTPITNIAREVSMRVNPRPLLLFSGFITRTPHR